MEITQKQFESFVSQAIDNIPKIYQDKLDNVRFNIEEEPSAEQRRELGMRPCDALYGLYQGVPLPLRGGVKHSIVPDVITIFMHPMIKQFRDSETLKKQIYKTVWHEVAHYFGLGHDRIHRAESSLDHNSSNN